MLLKLHLSGILTVSKVAARQAATAKIDRDSNMNWETPTFEEISLGCEINSYVNAEL